VTVPLAPLLEQGGGQQRQAARLVEHIDDEGLGERRLDPQADPARGLDDGPAELVASHRADQHLVGPDQPREPVMGRAAPVEIGAHGNHHLYAPVAVFVKRHERVHEGGPLTLVTADREQLLELVDDEHRSLAALRQHPLQLRQGMAAGAHQRLGPTFGAGQHPARERRLKARSHRRGLPAPRRSDYSEQWRTHEPGDQFGHQPLATEEVLRVGSVERG
jgi:hypothetical protein